MADIAQIGFAADTSALKEAKSSLDALVPAADKVDKSVEKVGDALDKSGKAAATAAKNIDKVKSSAEKAAAGVTAGSAAVNRAAAANDRMAATATVAAGANDNLAASNAAVTGSATTSTAAQFRLAAANEAVATSAAQAGAAAGAARIGMGTLAVGALAGVVALGVLVATLAAAVFGAVVFAGAFINLRTEVGKTTEGLNLTEKQLDRLAKKGIDTGVTLQDALAGFGYAVGQSLKDAFEGPLKGVAEWAKKAWDDILSFSTDALDAMVKATVGSVAAIIAVWGDIPGAVKDLFYQAVNGVIDGYNSIVQAGWEFFYDFLKMIAGIPGALMDAFNGGVTAAGNALDTLIGFVVDTYNAVVNTWRDWPRMLGDLFMRAVTAAFNNIVWLYDKSIAIIKGLWEAGKAIVTGNIGQVTNPFAGQAAAAADKAGAAYDRAGAAVDRFKKKFGADFRKGTLGARSDRVTKAAGGEGSAAKTPKGPKSDAEKFEDITKGAQADIATQIARAQATTLSAEAAATLEEKTKLLNAAQSKGITLTDAMKTKIDELAGAYGKAKVAADNAIALRDILKGADGDIAALKSQAELIGLVGRQLTYQTEMQKLLNAAKAKGLTIDAAMRGQFEDKANQIADQTQANKHDVFMDGVSKGADERRIALEQERAAIGLSADETRRLAIENDLLAQARQKNIDLTPADIAAIGQIASEQAATEASIRKTREAIDFAKDTARGFFKDITDGLRNGQSLWSSFADAAVKALNKITDRLIDKAINAGIDALFSAISGGSFANGGVFDSGSSGRTGGYGTGDTGHGTMSLYAKGGTFTNKIVDKPTMFASGGALGLMGEAGPEAIMPLKRGPDGSLGVQMHGPGDGNGGTVIHAPISIANDNRVTGAVSSADIVALQKRSAEQTKAQIARDIPAIIRQYQTDGAYVP
jgi:hypothetical protein